MWKTKKKLTIKDIIVLQAVVMLYTMSGVAAKYAAGEYFFSIRFVMFYAIEIGILGLYAILWQQIIKKIQLSIAYTNRAMDILWSLVWAILLFAEQITIKNIIGVIIVMVGTVIVNSDED